MFISDKQTLPQTWLNYSCICSHLLSVSRVINRGKSNFQFHKKGKKGVEICSLTNSIRAIEKKIIIKKFRAIQENNTELLDEVFVISGKIKVEVIRYRDLDYLGYRKN